MEELPGVETSGHCLWVGFSFSICSVLNAVAGLASFFVPIIKFCNKCETAEVSVG